jgi:hypothetical protein
MNRPQRIFIASLIAVALVLASLSLPTVRVSAQGAQRDDAAAAAAFEKIVPVLRHPRCMNCHSVGISRVRVTTAIVTRCRSTADRMVTVSMPSNAAPVIRTII